METVGRMTTAKSFKGHIGAHPEKGQSNMNIAKDGCSLGAPSVNTYIPGFKLRWRGLRVSSRACVGISSPCMDGDVERVG